MVKMELSEQTLIKLIEDSAATRQSVLDMKNTIESNNKVVMKLLEVHDGRINSVNKDVEDLKGFKNQMVGKISMIAAVCGAIGYVISLAVNWLWSVHK